MSEVTFRQLNRLSLSLPLRVSLRKHPVKVGSSMWQMNPAVERTVTENLSAGGCYFFLSQEPPVGSRVEMEITVPGEISAVPFARISCQGKVIRVDQGLADGGSGLPRFGVAAAIERLQEVNVESVPSPTGDTAGHSAGIGAPQRAVCGV